MTLVFKQSIPAKKANKYHAKKVVVDGLTFDSQKEANRWQQLKLMQQAGLIKNLERQVPYPLAKVIDGTDYVVRTQGGGCMRYYADFRYYDVGRKKEVVEDVKGVDTDVSAIKRAIVKMFYNIDVEII